MVTVGELNHSTLGFYEGHWTPDGESILAHGYSGSFHLWRNFGLDCENWKPHKVPSSHFAPVCDIAWSKFDEYVLSISNDHAQSVAVAELWLWEVASWKVVDRLQSHNLTVTKSELSHDDSFLLAVSRDRQFSVFVIEKYGDVVNHQLITKQEAHKRIIWACSSQLQPCQTSRKVLQPWLGRNQSSNTGILAVGTDNGLIELWNISGGVNTLMPFNASIAARFGPYLCHVSTVHCLAWRSDETGGLKTMALASCGGDNCVRLFEVRVN